MPRDRNARTAFRAPFIVWQSVGKIAGEEPQLADVEMGIARPRLERQRVGETRHCLVESIHMAKRDPAITVHLREIWI